MKRIARVCGVLAILAVSSATARAQVFVDGGRGPVLLRVPAGYDPGVGAPLLLLLHGYTANGPIQEAYMQFAQLVDEFGFLYMHPTGPTDCVDNPSWNATDACCGFCSGGVDDAGYLIDLIDLVKADYSVDERRIYLVGHSNGGFMSYRMACDYADVFAAVASLAGATFFEPNACMPAEPVHVLQIHGTSDGTILYGGGSILSVPYPGAIQTVEQWAAYNGCLSLPDTTPAPIDLVSSLPGAETHIAKYTMGCKDGGSSELWTIVNGSHVPALQPTFSRMVMEWLYAHPKAEPPGPGAGGVIRSNPSPGFIEEGSRLQLIAPTGSGYVWKKDTVIVADDPPRVTGAATGVLFFNPVLATDIGSYTVEYDDGTKALLVSEPFILELLAPGSLPLAGVTALAILIAVIGVILNLPKRKREATS